MKKIIPCLLVLFFAIPVFAGPETIIGGKPLSVDSGHSIAIGWPSMSYEWWNAGKPDWAIGGELVYGDWSGNFSNVSIGVAVNVPFRWNLKHSGKVDVGLKMVPGGMVGSKDSPGNNLFVSAIRGEMGVPITVDLNDRINLITGVAVPFTVMFVEHSDAFVIIPLLPRIGVEFEADHAITSFIMMELGPTIAIGNGNTDVELGVRSWIGCTFW